MSEDTEQSSPPNIEKQVQTVAMYLNTKLHDRARTINASFNEAPEKIRTVNIRNMMENTDSSLVKFLQLLTQSVRQGRRKLFQEKSLENDTKSIRLFYALCVLQFCTNTTVSSTLHITLTEAILCHGGSLELVRILNRVGAVASLDTANRLATYIVDKRITEGIHPELQPHMHSIVSVDIIDILQSYAFVSSLDSSISWHGTSVQCVQPLLVSGHLTPDDLHVSQTLTRKHPSSSPISTPVPVEKSINVEDGHLQNNHPHTQQ